MKIAYVLYGEILAPVVRAQTLPLLKALESNGHEPWIVALTSPRRLFNPSRWKKALDEAREAVGGRVILRTHLPKSRGFGWVAWRLRGALKKIGPDVVHARQSRAGLLAARAGVAPVLLDLRGIRPEEYMLGLGKAEPALAPEEKATVEALRRFDREALEGAAAVVCVSEPFRRRLKFGKDVFVVPNAAQPEEPSPRDEVRRKLGIAGDALTLVYSGSLAAWQCAGSAIRLFKDIRVRRGDARLVLLTHSPEAGKKLALQNGVKDAVVRRFSPAETKRTLSAFDLALLLREKNEVNGVAAPVKFAEYLHAGLPVVVTEGIGDVSEWVKNHELGVVLPTPEHEFNADRVLVELPKLDPARCRAWAKVKLTFEITAPMYEEACRAAIRKGSA